MKPSSQLALAIFVCSASVLAQEIDPGKAGSRSIQQAALAALEFSKPQLVEDVGAGAMIAGRFDCDPGGSIYTLMMGVTGGDPDSHLALMAIRPDGTTTNFSWWSAPGLAAVSAPPKSIFVGNGHVYVLAWAAEEQEGRKSKYPAVLIFNGDGTLEDTVKLEPDWNPLTLGVFASGNMLLASEDRLNHRMELSLVDDHGALIREIPLAGNDFVTRAAQLPPAARGPVNYSPTLLISMAKFVPLGDHLLLVPLGTGNLPILELDEHGVAGSTIPQLPQGTVLQGFISSGTSAFTVRLARLLESDKEVYDSQGKVLGYATEPSQRMTEISRESGRVLREIDLGAVGVQPACEANGAYRLLTSGAEQRLQVVAARLR
jgi:hypothetical protein